MMRIVGLQLGEIFTDDLGVLLLSQSVLALPLTVFPSIKADKIHSLVEIGHLLRIPVKHLGSHAVWVEQG